MSVQQNTSYRLVVRNATNNKGWEFDLDNQLEDDAKYYKFSFTIPEEMIPSEYQWLLYDPDNELVNQGLMQIREEKDETNYYDTELTYTIYEREE